MRVSCKGPLRASLYVYSHLEDQFYVRGCQQADVIIEYVTAPVLLTESVFM